MASIATVIREIWNGIFKPHTHCRACHVPIKDGGAIAPYVGRGFCPTCHHALVAHWLGRRL
jgi:hypothetical protein